jgi:hypothetical protein
VRERKKKEKRQKSQDKRNFVAGSTFGIHQGLFFSRDGNIFIRVF